MNCGRQTTQFAAEGDWIFASPAQLGRLPISYRWVWKCFQQAAHKAGIAKFGTHTLRHSYRTWLDAAGTAIAVQQKLMRHSNIRTALNLYGDVENGWKGLPKMVESLPNCIHYDLPGCTSVRGSKTDGYGLWSDRGDSETLGRLYEGMSNATPIMCVVHFSRDRQLHPILG
jgi:hypothetical protein